MAVNELAELDTAELEVRLVESRKELFNLRFQMATGQLDNTARIGRVKKDVARILTYLRQRDVALTEAEYAAAVSVEAERAAAAAARVAVADDDVVDDVDEDVDDEFDDDTADGAGAPGESEEDGS